MLHKYIKPHIFYLALLSFGITLCSAFQLSNLSSIFKFLGATNNSLPYFWIVPPLTGLIMQPVIGQLSDDTISRYGKRRPYIIAWGGLAALGLLLLPFTNSLLYALILTWIIGCSLNGSTEALRALTGDLTINQEERSKAFAIQAFAAGIGGSIGTSMPYLIYKLNRLFNFSNAIAPNELPINLKVSLLVSSIILLATTYLAMKKVNERPYTRDALLKKKKKKTSLSARLAKSVRDLYKSIRKMPPAFRKICIINGITWLGIFIFWTYFTVAIAQNIYGLSATGGTGDGGEYASILQKATLDTSVYFTIYQYVSIAFALILYFLSKSTKTKQIHIASLIIGGIGLGLLSFERSQMAIMFSFIAIGIMWGSLQVLPYTIAMQVLPKGKLGTYLGIFNISITLPQIIGGSAISPIYSYIFMKHAGYLLILAGSLILLSSYFWYREGRSAFAVRAPKQLNEMATEPT